MCDAPHSYGIDMKCSPLYNHGTGLPVVRRKLWIGVG